MSFSFDTFFRHVYDVFAVACAAFAIPYTYRRTVAALKNRPVLTKADIRYQEWTASGCSEANILTKIGGSSNCVRLIVTADTLVVTSWGFPLTIFSAFYDMEHVIPLKSLQSIERKRTFVVELLRLTYQDAQGRSCKILLRPKNMRAFLEAIGQNPAPVSQ